MTEGACPECHSAVPQWRHFHGCSVSKRQARERVLSFLEEQEALGRPDTHELWASTQRPEHVITLGDLQTLVNW